MANKPKGFGMSADIAKKIAASFDPQQATDVVVWMKSVLEYGKKAEAAAKMPDKITEMKEVYNVFKDGVLMLEVLNVMFPEFAKKINKGKMAFMQMENISNFVKYCTSEQIGCEKGDLFTTADLYEQGNIPQVINGLSAFARKSHKVSDPDDPFGMPTYGPVESTENKREFTEEQLNEGKHIIGLQAGSNKGASQAGMNFGKTRAVLD